MRSSALLPRLLAAGGTFSSSSLRQHCRPSSSRLPQASLRRLSVTPRALSKAPESLVFPTNRIDDADGGLSQWQLEADRLALDERFAAAFVPSRVSKSLSKLKNKRKEPKPDAGMQKIQQTAPELPPSSAFTTPGLEAEPNFALSHLPLDIPKPPPAEEAPFAGQPAVHQSGKRNVPKFAQGMSESRVFIQGLPKHMWEREIDEFLYDLFGESGRVIIGRGRFWDPLRRDEHDGMATVDFSVGRGSVKRSPKAARKLAAMVISELDSLPYPGSTLRVMPFREPEPEAQEGPKYVSKSATKTSQPSISSDPFKQIFSQSFSTPPAHPISFASGPESQPRPPLGKSKTRIFISNLPARIWEDELEAILRDKVGAAGTVQVSRGRTIEGTPHHSGFAFVQFAQVGVDHQEAERLAAEATAALDGCEVEGSCLSVEPAEIKAASKPPHRTAALTPPRKAAVLKGPSSDQIKRTSTHKPMHSNAQGKRKEQSGWKKGVRAALDGGEGFSDRTLFASDRTLFDSDSSARESDGQPKKRGSMVKRAAPKPARGQAWSDAVQPTERPVRLPWEDTFRASGRPR